MSIHLKRCLCKPLVKANSPQYMSSIPFIPRWGGNRRGEKEQVGEPMLLSSWVVCQLGDGWRVWVFQQIRNLILWLLELDRAVWQRADASEDLHDQGNWHRWMSQSLILNHHQTCLSFLSNMCRWANESNLTTCNSRKPRPNSKGDYMASKLMSRPARWSNEVSKN